MEQKKWYSLSFEDIVKDFNSNISNGLSSIQVEELRNKYGLNEITSKKKKSVMQMIIEQFKDFMIIILLVAAIVSRICWNPKWRRFY